MMKNIFSKFLTSKKNRKRLSMSDSNEFGGIISKSSPIAIVDEPVTFTSTVDFTDATINGLTSGWSLDGNSGTNFNTNFIGTNDAQPLVLKTNNTQVGYLPLDTYDNIIFGKNTGFGNFYSITIGNDSNNNVNGLYNLLIGNSIQNLDAPSAGSSYNVILGHESGTQNRSSYNLIAGYQTAQNLSFTADKNVILGTYSSNNVGNPDNIVPTIGTLKINSGDTNWNKISETTWETTGAVAAGVRTNFYTPYFNFNGLSYRLTVTATLNTGLITVNRRGVSVSDTFTLGIISSTGVFNYDFPKSGQFRIDMVTSSDFSGSFSLNLGVTVLDKINNSVIIGNESKPKSNDGTNEIVLGYGAIGKGSNTVQIGNTSITNTYLQGNLQLPAYGDGTITGTPTKALAVDTDGKVLEVPYNNAQVYVALLSQAGTAAPTAVVLENSIGNVTYTRDSAGVYNVVLPSTITNGISRIYATIQTNTTTKYLIVSDMPATDVSTFQIECTGEALSDDFTRAKFEIRIYP